LVDFEIFDKSRVPHKRRVPDTFKTRQLRQDNVKTSLLINYSLQSPPLLLILLYTSECIDGGPEWVSKPIG